MAEESSRPKRRRTKPKPEPKVPASGAPESAPGASSVLDQTSLSAILAAQKSMPGISGILAAQKSMSDISGLLAAQKSISGISEMLAATEYVPSIARLIANYESSGIWKAIASQNAIISGLPYKSTFAALADAVTSTSRLQSEAIKAASLASRVQFEKDALAAGTPVRVTAAEPEEPTSSPLEAELRRLEAELTQRSQELLAAQSDKAGQEKEIAELNGALEKLSDHRRYAFLLTQLHPQAGKLLEDSEEFRRRFLHQTECTGFVMSVDIRRSTDLMLKARRPEQFANFVSSLCGQLASIVLDSFGVFDKFTGDGVLAFFPDFYSGPDAGYYALSAAKRCHDAFALHYRENRNAFISVLQEAGLGIGIDYGTFSLVQVSGGLTVVGAPVVYACRMGGAPAGSTLLNQPAFEVVSEKYGAYFSFDETELAFKHDGPTLAYRVRGADKVYEPSAPDWISTALAPNSEGERRDLPSA